MKRPPGMFREPPLGPHSERWLNELSDWLLLTRDPRLVLNARGRCSIANVCAASADFCQFLARVTEAGHQASTWRKHWREFS